MRNKNLSWAQNRKHDSRPWRQVVCWWVIENHHQSDIKSTCHLITILCTPAHKKISFCHTHTQTHTQNDLTYWWVSMYTSWCYCITSHTSLWAVSNQVTNTHQQTHAHTQTGDVTKCVMMFLEQTKQCWQRKMFKNLIWVIFLLLFYSPKNGFSASLINCFVK